MKKILTLLVVCSTIFTLVGCTNKEAKGEVLSGVVAAPLNSEGNIEINENSITKNAAFLCYDADDTTIGLLAVRGTDDKVRVTLGTCQACSPSPKAYFAQDGEYFECQKCGNKFHVDQIGKEKDGCNPIVIEEKTENDGVITISTDYLKTFEDLFIDWDGPKIN